MSTKQDFELGRQGFLDLIFIGKRGEQKHGGLRVVVQDTEDLNLHQSQLCGTYGGVSFFFIQFV